MKGSDLMDKLAAALGVDTDSKVALALGVSQPAISGLRNTSHVTPLRMVRLIVAARRSALKSAIHPIVESFRIEKVSSKNGNGYELFTTKDDGKEHPYRKGLRDELEKHYGIYIFYDTRGRALYVGKARKQNLWNEMRSAFNRNRDTQRVRRVAHPTRRVKFKRGDEQMRQIQIRSVRLHDLAGFFSAYHVADDMIGEVEAMLVRSFSNDLLNVRMEKFTTQRGW